MENQQNEPVPSPKAASIATLVLCAIGAGIVVVPAAFHLCSEPKVGDLLVRTQLQSMVEKSIDQITPTACGDDAHANSSPTH